MQGFHANDVESCNRFIDDETYMIVSKDNDYLGTGMYFWEHRSNAEYWLESKKNNTNSGIVSADILLGSLLDLTDDEVCKKMANVYTLIGRAKTIALEKSFKGKPVPFGQKLDYLFEAFSDMSKYDCIRGREIKDKKPESSFLYGSNVSTKSIDIYCVRNVTAITNRNWVA